MGKLRDAQDRFAGYLARLIDYAHGLGLTLQLGDVWRAPELADLYAQRGVGVRDSLHCSRLAVDMLIRVHGVLQEDSEAYRPLGEFWESLDPRARWGGRFPRPDGNHFELLP